MHLAALHPAVSVGIAGSFLCFAVAYSAMAWHMANKLGAAWDTVKADMGHDREWIVSFLLFGNPWWSLAAGFVAGTIIYGSTYGFVRHDQPLIVQYCMDKAALKRQIGLRKHLVRSIPLVVAMALLFVLVFTARIPLPPALFAMGTPMAVMGVANRPINRAVRAGLEGGAYADSVAQADVPRLIRDANVLIVAYCVVQAVIAATVLTIMIAGLGGTES